jgi:hypothetical protein
MDALCFGIWLWAIEHIRSYFLCPSNHVPNGAEVLMKFLKPLKNENGLLFLILAIVGAVAIVVWVAHRL